VIDGFIFGFLDNGILILSMYAGLNIDKWFELSKGGLLGAVLGATLGNTFSDTVAAALDPSMVGSITGITLGCLIPIIILIPLIEWLKRLWNK
tara:strand:+ start:48 stop:326 length:279 start_codon:yes stop_codon:yes gene_type:complete